MSVAVSFILLLPFVLLSCVGMTWILMYGKILNKPRKWITQRQFFGDLLKCSMCTGFHSGWIHSLPLLAFVILTWGQICLLASLLCLIGTIMLPFGSAGVCYMIDRITIAFDELGSYISIKNGN